MVSQTKNVKYNGHEIFKEHHKDNKNRQKRPETMEKARDNEKLGVYTDTYRNVALIRLWPSGERQEKIKAQKICTRNGNVNRFTTKLSYENYISKYTYSTYRFSMDSE